jgi:preprotein translocase subunit SecA
VLDFDDVANDQRKVIYEQRNELLESEGVGETVASIREDVFRRTACGVSCRPIRSTSNGIISGLEKELESEFGLKLDLRGWLVRSSTRKLGARWHCSRVSKTPRRACSARRKP